MERYVVIDLQEMTLLNTSDLYDMNSGSSVRCKGIDDLKSELNTILK